MDAVLLSRIQFGVTIGFHYLFPATTLGLTFFIVIFESLYVESGKDVYRRISSFLVRILAPVFIMGVATGLLMPFSFGTNWAQFSRIMGEVFGPFLAIESTVAFSLESVFLAVLLFGRNRVGKKMYWMAAYLVFFGSHLSAFIIVAANSWMQTPAGYEIINNRVVLGDMVAAILNPSTTIRFLHVITAAWTTGSVVVAAMGAWFLLRNRHVETARTMLRVAVPLLLVMILAEVGLGHHHILTLNETQPAKAAAFEGIFTTQRNAPLYLFGIPDAANKRIRFGVAIPGMLSFLEGWSFNAEVKGLEDVPSGEMPPVNAVFSTFRIMELMGFLLIGAGITGVVLLWRKKLFTTRWFLVLLVGILPAPYLATEAGWISTEMGRQPWIVYGLLKTGQAASVNVPGVQVLVSLIVLSAVYLLLFAVLVTVLRRIMHTGPEAGVKA